MKMSENIYCKYGFHLMHKILLIFYLASKFITETLFFTITSGFKSICISSNGTPA